MSIEVQKQEKENTQSLIRRFSKKIQKSGVLVRARSIRFHKRTLSGQLKKRVALRRQTLKEAYEKEKKMGTLKPKTKSRMR